MKLKTARKAIWISYAGAIIFGVLLFITERVLFLILLLASLIINLFIYVLFIRCPHCGWHPDLALIRLDTRVCPFCGRELEDGCGEELDI